jgi:hypothetical protein
MTVDELRKVLRTAGFIDPDDGTVPMWPNGDVYPQGAVWVSGRKLCEVIIANWRPDD